MTMAYDITDMVGDVRDYDNWMGTLAEASARLDDLQTAVTELRELCEDEVVDRGQILEVLARHSAA